MPTTPRRTRYSIYARGEDDTTTEPISTPTSSRPHESTSVQDRVRQWQAQGAASAPAPDALSVRSIPLSSIDQSQSRPHSPEQITAIAASERRRRGRRQDITERDVEDKARSQSAPRKRIISDGHWRAKKSERHSSVRKREAKQEPTSRYDLTYTSNAAPEDDVRQQRTRRKSKPTVEKIIEEPVTKVQLNDRLDTSASKHQRRRVFSYEEDFDAQSQNSLHFVDEITIRPGQSISPGIEEVPLPISRKKGRIASRSNDLLTNRNTVLKPSNRLPSVETWLDEQPDPFIDTPTPEFGEPVEVPKPLRKRPKRPRASNNMEPVIDPNGIWNSIDNCEEPPAYEAPINAGISENPKARRESRRALRAKALNTTTPREDLQQSVVELEPKLTKAESNRELESVSLSKQSHEATKVVEGERQRPRERQSRRKWRDRPLPPLPPAANDSTPLYTNIPDESYEVENCQLKRKLTTHEDLMSVLSLPGTGKKVKSARSVKHLKAKITQQSSQELLLTLKADEEKYNRELRTLVDGVIPVLLQCVLSKTSSSLMADLFKSSTSTNDQMNVTKPIIDMGIALERLKSLHNRIPLHSVDSLLIWGQSAQRAYTDYLQSWRLGFQDVIVNLAPLQEGEQAAGQMPRDAQGDVIDAEGKKVDVAYLLKRPLVRVKNLAKTFESISKQSETRLATDLLQVYTDLTALARRRHQEEQARLEDEAASTLDSSKVRDVRTLSSATGIVVDPTRKVKARDCFNLTLYHSNGQRIDCKIEMILRDNPSSKTTGGDVLVCEIDDLGKWLLFPPIDLSSISARRGEDDFDLVVMIRGPAGMSGNWQELFALKAEIPEAASEWLNMLGSNPLPPRLNQNRSFAVPGVKSTTAAATKHSDLIMTTEVGLDEVDIPLGEPSIISSRSDPRNRSPTRVPLLERFIPRLGLGGGLQSKPRRHQFSTDQHLRNDQIATTTPTLLSDSSTVSSSFKTRIPPPSKSASAPPTPTGQNCSVPKLVHNFDLLPSSSGKMPGSLSTTPSREASPTRHTKGKQHKMLKTEQDQVLQKEEALSSPDISVQPGYGRAMSSTPTLELPTVNKPRALPTPPGTSSSTPLRPSIGEQWNALSAMSKKHHQETVPLQGHTDAGDNASQALQLAQSIQDLSISHQEESAPAPPPHREMGLLQSRLSDVASQDPQPKHDAKKATKRPGRSTSPLKHEYAPSTASESDGSSDSESDGDSSSETSEDSGSECGDLHTPLVALTHGARRGSRAQQEQQAPPQSSGTRTLAPSDSASQGPYRRVPSSTTVPPTNQARAIALVCSWSERGMWEQIYPDECSIVISPGLIEAFEMSEAHSGFPEHHVAGTSQDSRSSSMVQQPIVAFELTPIVPLRKGTALDISIRSLPTPNSQIKTTNNVLFRARTAEECDKLYNLINWARCNNPTYIQLQNARPVQPPVTFNFGNFKKKGGKAGWFGFGGLQRKSSYRAAPIPAPGLSSVQGSDASAATMMSTFSALKRLGVSSAFNINRSSVVRKDGSSRGGSSLYSSSNGTRLESRSTTPVQSQAGYIPGKDGPNAPQTSAAAANGGGMVNNMKIRLYVRKGQQWENLGAGRLSVLPALDTKTESNATPSRGAASTGSPSTTTPISRAPTSTIYGKPQASATPRLPSASHTPHRVHGNGREKRVLIVKNKETETVLLDAVLGESCFERIMQTGIAVKVWSEDEHIGHTGGVVMGREKIYMMQFPGNKEAGWVFQMCGTYRYGD